MLATERPAVRPDAFELIAKNAHYEFILLHHEGRWCAAAKGNGVLFLIPEISERALMGMVDRAEAIRRLGVIAASVEQGWGGVGQWFADRDLLIDGAPFRCPTCGDLYCEDDHGLEVDLSEFPA
jgi:hypothetical protein